MGGFDIEELSSLITLLTAISAIYMGALFKYIGGNILQDEDDEQLSKPVNVTNAKLITKVIPLHFVLLSAIISAKAFTLIPFPIMNIFLGLIEAVFGTYLGMIINQIFLPPKGKPKQKEDAALLTSTISSKKQS